MRVISDRMNFRHVSPSSHHGLENDGRDKPSHGFETRRMPAEGSDFTGYKDLCEMERSYRMKSMEGSGGAQFFKHSEMSGDGSLSRLDFSPRTLSKLVHRERTRGHHSPSNEIQTGSSGSLVENVTPPLSEQGRITPPHLRWAQNLQSLLNDKEGVELFERFLMQEGFGLHDLKFWFACQGLKNYDPGSKNIHQVIKVIYKKYVKTCLVMLNAVTRQDIADKVNSKTGMDQTIFDRAQRELEENTLQNVYFNFLKSDMYLQHVQRMQQDEAGALTEDDYDEDCNKLVGLSSNSNNSASKETIPSNFLPTLHEDKELESGRNMAFAAHISQRDGKHYRFSSNRYADALRYSPEQVFPGRRSNTSHVKYSGYLPVSAQDSELQSLSSDAQTDDTMSVTTDGSSIDCTPSYNSRSQCKKLQRAMKRNASLNKDPLIHHNFIPRTQRILPERLVEKHPEQFAAILIEKLNKVKKDLDGYAKLDESLRQIDTDDGKVPAQYTPKSTSCSGEMPSALARLTKLPPQLLFNTANVTAAVTEENDQSILDQHVSRVWNDSTCQSPLSKTPGQQSPPLLLRPHMPQNPLDRRRMASPAGAPPSWSSVAHSHATGHCANPVQEQICNSRVQPIYNAVRSRRERDACSSDSGTVRDFTPDNEPDGFSLSNAQYQFHKHLHHHATSSGSVPKEVSKRSNSVKKTNTVGTDSSSCVDSGVSVCDPFPPPSLPSHERVFSWVLDNEKYSYTHGSDSEKDSTRHRKSSHSSISTQSSATGKQGHSKKPTAYNVSRPNSSEHSGARLLQEATMQSANTGVGNQYTNFPRQPVAADPFMPILPPPNTTTQLFEAKRRLEDEAAKGKLPKPKMLTSSGKEKYDSQKNRIVLKTDISDESLRKSVKRTQSQSLNIANANVCGQSTTSIGPNDSTVIGYCFSGETVPYRTKLNGKNITLKQFKSLISKKGNYRYFFKRSNNEFGTGVVNEEVSDDNEVLPLWEGKIFCTIDPIVE